SPKTSAIRKHPVVIGIGLGAASALRKRRWTTRTTVLITMALIGGETTASPSSFSAGDGGVGMTGGGTRPGGTIRTLIMSTTNRFMATTGFHQIGRASCRERV